MSGQEEIAGSLDVDCEIGGELIVHGKLIIGEKGIVRGNVRAVDAVVKGIYEGHMTATGNVEIAATGHVTGHITAHSLVIAEGAFFHGTVTRAGGEDPLLERVVQNTRMV